jgi:DNA polymerase-3 subunit alpha
MTANFIHLRVHSAYSLSQGAIHLKELAKLCVKHGMPAVAVTDTNNLFGALEASTVLTEAGIQPIVGCTLSVDLPAANDSAVHTSSQLAPQTAPLVLLVQNSQGYDNLMALVSQAHLSGRPGDPSVTLADLTVRHEGLIALTGGALGPLGILLRDGQAVAARKFLQALKDTFPNRLYVEIERHDTPAEHAVESSLLDLAYEYDLPLVATNDVHFATRDMFEAHDALLCIADGTYVSEDDRRRLTPEHYFKSAEDMRLLFADLPEAVSNTVVIAQRCAFKSPKRKPILPKFTGDSGGSEAQMLQELAAKGLEERLAAHVFTPGMSEAEKEAAAKPYRDRLAYEVDIITRMDFPGYFLIVSDFIRWAKRNNIPVGPGRGSGAGSLVAWSLYITDLDPLRWGLLFERFLNPERVSMPDFDVDFCQDKRDQVIRYVQDRYGRDQVAQIITFGKLQARAVLRDVGRVLQLPYGQVDRICKMVPNNPANPVTLAQALESEARLRYERDSDEAVARMIDIALKLEGLYRHASTHAAGVVIGDRPLTQLVPLYRDPRSDIPATQFNMKWVEAAGLVKFDFLGLKTLTVLAKAVELLKRRGINLDLDRLPLDDKATFELLSKGNTVGVFQLEGSGMRAALTQLKPDKFEDIIAMVSLYRPGPMDNIPSYIKRKHGQEEPDYLHPLLEPVLKETYGVIIYQEQVMQIAQILADYSLGEADLLRRAMGKKIASEMAQQRARFEEGAIKKGVKKEQATYIFDLVDKFAGYGFNKSHAAAYALVAYQTAYLKAHYPVEFIAATMTYDMANTDKLNVFKQDAARLNIPLLPPDVNKSEATFTVEQTTDGEGKPVLGIRYALAAVKNVGVHAMELLTAARTEGGPFKSLSDFANRLDSRLVNKRTIENLAKAGAFDSLHPNRRQCHDGADIIMRHAQSAAMERTSQQENLFGDAAAVAADLPLPPVEDWLLIDRLRAEYEAVGFYLSAHPLDAYAKTLRQERVVTSGDLQRMASGGATHAKVAGTVQSIKERRTKTGKPMAHVTLSDSAGSFEVTLFEETLNASRALLVAGQSLVMSCEIRLDGDTLRLTANKFDSIDRVAEKSGRGLKVVVSNTAPLASLQAVLARAKGGRGLVTIAAAIPERDEEVEVRLPGRYSVSQAVRAEVARLSGILEVEEV